MRSISANTENGIYDISMSPTRDLAMVVDKACVRQDCLLSSQMLLGEFPFDTNRGVPYMESLFKSKNPYVFEQGLKSEILQVPNVASVGEFKMFQVDDVLQYEVTIQSTFGPVNL